MNNNKDLEEKAYSSSAGNNPHRASSPGYGAEAVAVTGPLS